MKQKIFSVIVFALFTIQVQTIGAEEMSQIEVAKQYYLALYSGDHDKVRELASTEMVFEDSSAPEETGIPPLLNGLESFLNFMQSNTQQDSNIDFTDSFVSNDRVVLMVDTKGTIAAALVGMGEEGMVEYTARGISVLHVVDGKVLRHTDYFDYPGLSKTFKLIEK